MTRAFVAAVAAVLVLPGVTGAMPIWTSPHPLSSSDGRSVVPELAVNASGAALAVWDHETGSGCVEAPDALSCIHTVEAVSRTGSGAGWESPVALARPGVGATPRVAVNDVGSAAVIWVHDIGRDRVLQATYRPGVGGTFPNPNDLSGSVLEIRNHEVALDSAGDVVVVWAERQADVFEVAAEVRLAAHGVWGAPILLSRAPVTAGPSLAVTPGGEAFAVWMEGDAVRVARGDVARGIWEPAQTVSSTAGAAPEEPLIATNQDGDAAAVWVSQGTVQTASRPVAGAWTAPTDVGQGLGTSAQPTVALDGAGNAVAAWIGQLQGMQSATRSRAGQWSRPVDVAQGVVSTPVLAVAPRGDAVAAWRDEATASVHASTRPAAAGTWQPAVALTSPDAATPRVAIDSAGRAVAVWTAGPPAAVAVVSADLEGDWQPSLANIRPPRVRGIARVGRTLVCERGAWDGTVPITYGYRWLRNRQVIRTRSPAVRYVIRREDAGALLACRVTAANAARTLVVTSQPVRVAPR